MLIAILFLVLHWYLSLFSQTFFLHRYAAHKMFIMNKFWERYFSLFAYITQGSSYLSPRAYAIMHRMHHAFSDTPKDPHSPHNHSNVFTMMWKTKDIYIDYVRNKVMPDARFDMKPIWEKLEKLGETWFSRLAWGTAYTFVYIGLYIYADMPMWCFLFIPIHYLMGPIHGAIVNWSGHKYGYSNFDNNDKSKNSLIWDFLMLGELFQNNHHKLPNRVNFGARWFELDPTYPVIKMLMLLRIIRLNPNPVGH
jgi:stearoyl-CoA desaturase (Delta-9 desaturase)